MLRITLLNKYEFMPMFTLGLFWTNFCKINKINRGQLVILEPIKIVIDRQIDKLNYWGLECKNWALDRKQFLTSPSSEKFKNQRE